MREHRNDKYLSIRITRILMKIVGFWYVDNKREQLLIDGLMVYTIFSTFNAIAIECLEFYNNVGSFYGMVYSACTAMPVIIVMVKISQFLKYRNDIREVIRYAQEEFWHVDYDAIGEKILQDTNRRGVALICTFTCCVQATVVCYTLTPIIENIGKNESDRVLPFPLAVDLPLSYTPYFEIMFLVETIALVHGGICFCCFDNFVCIMALHVASQFKIIKRRLNTAFDEVVHSYDDGGTGSNLEEKLKNFYKHVKRHAALLDYNEKLRTIFSYCLFTQLIISSALLCVAGFQVFLGQGILMRRLIFVSHSFGSFVQILMITSTGNEIVLESTSVADAAYLSNWYLVPFNDSKGRKLRKNLLMIIARSHRAAGLTAAGFFIVSLETFMKVLSTSLSYFAVLRQVDVDMSEF